MARGCHSEYLSSRDRLESLPESEWVTSETCLRMLSIVVTANEPRWASSLFTRISHISIDMPKRKTFFCSPLSLCLLWSSPTSYETHRINEWHNLYIFYFSCQLSSVRQTSEKTRELFNENIDNINYRHGVNFWSFSRLTNNIIKYKASCKCNAHAETSVTIYRFGLVCWMNMAGQLHSHVSENSIHGDRDWFPHLCLSTGSAYVCTPNVWEQKKIPIFLLFFSSAYDGMHSVLASWHNTWCTWEYVNARSLIYTVHPDSISQSRIGFASETRDTMGGKELWKSSSLLATRTCRASLWFWC